MEKNLITGDPESSTERARRESVDALSRGGSGAVKLIAAPTSVVGSTANILATKVGKVEAIKSRHHSSCSV